MDKLKNQLAGFAALLGVIAAIGGGFVKYGEVMTKLEALESQESKDFSAEIAVLQEQVKEMEDKIIGTENHGHTKILINQKEIDLLKLDIKEIKEASKNPLG